MNRVILIGNGFDLAHGLKTDYNSFMVWYFKNALQKSYDTPEHVYEDNLLRVETLIPGHSLNFILNFNSSINGISDLVDYYYKTDFKTIINIDSNAPGNYGSPSPFRISSKSYFFLKLVKNCSYSNWVQIENEFYHELITCKDSIGRVNVDGLKMLNDSMTSIISALEEYLRTIDTSPYIKGYEDIMIPYNDRYSNLILNFNYTDTVEKYLDGINRKGKFSFQRNYIHGKINDAKNPLIFGFGDELDKNYHEIELINNNLFFKYIKSFWYFNTVNYSALESFLGMSSFEIYILGHSCGLSDRTLLNTLFEHPMCSHVKIFYYQNEKGNNFTELTYEISRHFKSKAGMRSKIVPFPKCQRMPQIGDVE